MKISIVIPVYNVERYIRRCLESVIEQESENFDIECILVDDCSPDSSVEVAKDVINGYHGSNISFVLLQHKVNKGVSVARNTGVAAATGDFLFFMDSDDVIAENAFKYLFSYLIDFPYVDVVMGNMLEMEQPYLSNTGVTGNDNNYYLIDDKSLIWNLVLRRKIDRHVVNKLFRRSVIVDNNLSFDEEVTIYEDTIWTYKFYSFISSLIIVPALTYTYEINNASITHTTDKKARKTLESLVVVSDFVFSNPPIINGQYIQYTAHRLFVSHWMMMAIDVKDKHHIDSDYNTTLYSLRNAMLWDAVRHFRPFLTLFFLIMYAPVKSLMKYRWFRSNFYRLEELVYRIS